MATNAQTTEITGLLKAWCGGDRQALDRLAPLIAEDLRRLAHHYMRGEREDHTLQATALVNEAWLRLVDVTGVNWQDRAHFFAISAQMMRRILTDAARAHHAEKRGGEAVQVNLDDAPEIGSGKDREMVALDDALHELARLDPRKAKVIELRFFGGLSVEETAVVLKVSEQTIMRDWKLARLWLQREMQRG